MRRDAIVLAGFLLLPSVVLAAPQTYQDLVILITGLINSLIGVLLLAAFVVYLFSLAMSMVTTGENSRQKVKDLFFWGITILFVMVSLWGIVWLLHDTLFKNGDASSSISQDSTP